MQTRGVVVLVLAVLVSGGVLLRLADSTPRLLDSVLRPEYAWQESYRSFDTNPFGCQAVFDLVRSSQKPPVEAVYYSPEFVFEGYADKILGYNRSLAELAKPDTLGSTPYSYVLISNELTMSEQNAQALLRSAEFGNTVFIAANRIYGYLADTLGVELTFPNQSPFPAPYELDPSSEYNRQEWGRFLQPTGQVSVLTTEARTGTAHYTVHGGHQQGYVSVFNPKRTEILGFTRDLNSETRRPNFIRIPYGAGQILLHANPILLTNYYTAHDSVNAYQRQVLSYLPTNQPVLWDESQKPDGGAAKPLLSFFMNDRSLRAAAGVFVAICLVYVLAYAKRRQRTIPVLQPNVNTTLTFIEAIAQLYFSRKAHASIGQKQITFFLDDVRNRLLLPTDKLDADFWARLAEKAEIPPERLTQLRTYIQELDRNPEIRLTETQLLELYRALQAFYRDTQRFAVHKTGTGLQN
jgi:hypothetical protein